jgi:hypothetical protein
MVGAVEGAADGEGDQHGAEHGGHRTHSGRYVMMSGRSSLHIGLTAALLSLTAVAACGGESDNQGSSPSTSADVETAVGVIAIGHSGLTAEHSDPDRPGAPAPENSWATGTAPELNSIYQRVVAARPETEGHVANLAQGGALASTLRAQASAALEQVAAPALVIVQTVDGDIRCDGTDQDHIAAFGASLAAALEVITTASPDSRILIVGQLGRPSPRFIEQLVAADPTVRAGLTGSGMCDFFDSAGNIVEQNFETLTTIIEGYEAEQARVCAAVPHCRTDDGARAAYVDELENFSSDWNHLNLHGQARAAEIVWPIVAELLELS